MSRKTTVRIAVIIMLADSLIMAWKGRSMASAVLMSGAWVCHCLDSIAERLEK